MDDRERNIDCSRRPTAPAPPTSGLDCDAFFNEARAASGALDTAARTLDSRVVMRSQRRVQVVAGPRSVEAGDVTVDLGDAHTLEIVPRAETARLTLKTALGAKLLELEIVVTSSGAVVRGTAGALEIEASRVSTSCDSFIVDAREQIQLRSGGGILQDAAGPLEARARSVDIEARRGDVRLRANDDVQLLGEQVLLNCDRSPPVPAWASEPWTPSAPIAKEAQSGDPALIADVVGLLDGHGAR